MSNRSFTDLALFLGAVVAPFTASAQVLYGSLTGDVTDVSGSAVPNARVDATNIATGIGKQAATDGRGVFLMQDLQAGVYKVKIGAPSFATLVESGVLIAENTDRRVDIQLQVANVGQTVTVQADAAVLRTDRADVSGVPRSPRWLFAMNSSGKRGDEWRR
jgi:Carboxypeptidase regulatory-like domain